MTGLAVAQLRRQSCRRIALALKSVACERYEAMEHERTDMMGYGIRSAIESATPPSRHSPSAGRYADGLVLTEEGT